MLTAIHCLLYFTFTGRDSSLLYHPHSVVYAVILQYSPPRVVYLFWRFVVFIIITNIVQEAQLSPWHRAMPVEIFTTAAQVYKKTSI